MLNFKEAIIIPPCPGNYVIGADIRHEGELSILSACVMSQDGKGKPSKIVLQGHLKGPNGSHTDKTFEEMISFLGRRYEAVVLIEAN